MNSPWCRTCEDLWDAYHDELGACPWELEDESHEDRQGG